jgi:flagellar assembly protein FliH
MPDHPPPHNTWVQHGRVRVHNITTHLPHLLDNMPAVETPEQGAPVEYHEALHELESSASMRVAEIEALAEARIAAAQAETARWRDHALEAESESRARGFAAGYAEGAQKGRIEAEAAVQAQIGMQAARLARMARQARMDLRRALRDAEAPLAMLSLAVARAIIGETVRLHPEILARRISTLLEEIGESAQTVVRMHPVDLEALEPVWPQSMRARRNGDHAPRLVGDSTLAEGDCIIEGQTRAFDARLDPLFDRVAQIFAAIPLPEIPASQEREA